MGFWDFATRGLTIKKGLLYPMIFLLIVPVQAVLLPSLHLLGASPDLVLIAIYLIGFQFGELDGVFMGMALGFLLDFFSLGVLGVNFLLGTALGLVAGLVGRFFLDMALPVNFVIVFFISLAQDVVADLLLNLASEGGGFLYLLKEHLLLQAAYTAALATLLFYLIGRRNNPGGARLGEGVLFTPGRDSGASG